MSIWRSRTIEDMSRNSPKAPGWPWWQREPRLSGPAAAATCIACLLSALATEAARTQENPLDAEPGDRPAALSQRLDPPTGVARMAGEPRLDEPFEVEVEIQWAGDLSQYLLQPPRVATPPGMESLGVSGSTSSRDGTSRVTYRLRFVARQPGPYVLDPVEIRYAPRSVDDPRVLEIAGPGVEIRPRTVAGLPPYAAGLAAGAAGLVALAGGVLWVRRRRAGGEKGVGETAHERLPELLREAREARVRGRTTDCLERLVILDRELGRGVEDPTLAAALEASRYGGRAPASEQLDGWERNFERRLSCVMPAAAGIVSSTVGSTTTKET